jgi:hypothetical protein
MAGTLTAGSAVSLRPAFALTACAYGLAVALAAVGGRRTQALVGHRTTTSHERDPMSKPTIVLVHVAAYTRTNKFSPT